MRRMMSLLCVWIFALLTTRSLSTLVTDAINWESFLGRHNLEWGWSHADHVWSFLPADWTLAPFTGNGLLGALAYVCDHGQGPGGARCASVGDTPEFRLEIGRQDIYDQRQPYGNLWERPRLPVGYLRLQTAGTMQAGNMTLDLWNALLNGTIITSKGEITMKILTHAVHDVVTILWNTTSGESDAKWIFEPETVCYGSEDDCRVHYNPKQKCSSFKPSTGDDSSEGMLCTQLLESPYMGNFSSALLPGVQAGQHFLYVTISSSVWPYNTTVNAQVEAIRTLENVSISKIPVLLESHKNVWHLFYPMSFLSISDTRLEAFYWIQMYVMRSGMRAGGPVRDLIGPWFIHSNWPAIWNDLNLQLTYWPVYASNHLDLGRTLIDHLRRNLANGHWTWNCVNYGGMFNLTYSDAAGIGGACSSDGFSPMKTIETDDAEFGNLLWLCHNVWLQCQYEYNQTCFLTDLLPLLSRSIAWYRHFLVNDGINLRLPPTRSPEYPLPLGWDASYDISLLRWSCDVLIDLCQDNTNKVSYPCNMTNFCDEVQELLISLHVDNNTGIMVYANRTFSVPHRHFSHLLVWLPLHVFTMDNKTNRDILVKSLDTYYEVTFKSKEMTGFWFAAVAAMSALAGRGSAAIGNLTSLLEHQITPNTFYMEDDNPVPESPAAAAYALQTTLLQSYGGIIRIFPAVPRSQRLQWSQAVFYRLRAERGFLVSALMDDVVQWILIENEMGASPCSIEVDLIYPFTFNTTSSQVTVTSIGPKRIDILGLQRGNSVLIYSTNNKPDKFVVQEVVGNQTEYHYYGYHKHTATTTFHASD